MRILWLCNMMLPAIAQIAGESAAPFGGWMSGLLNDLLRRNNIEVVVCFPYNNRTDVLEGQQENLRYFGYHESDDNEEIFCKILHQTVPDVIHIWGTEFKHSLDMVNAAEEYGALEKVVVSIQGLVSICGKYHFYAGLPEKICKSATAIEVLQKSNIEHGKKDFLQRGTYEEEVLKRVHHVIGRTDWDKACTTQVNPNLFYHHCNETLRDSFYHNEWKFENCRKHSIFVSQANYPLKGFHYVLEAMPLILRRYPDTKIYVTGDKPVRAKRFKGKLFEHSYMKYIANLITLYHLDECVNFVGYLNEECMCSQYLEANVFVSASSIENSSNSIGEAMLLGVPVVSSDVGGVKNLMLHEKEGYIYQADAPYMLAYYVCKVFEDKDRATEIGRAAQKHAAITHDKNKNLKDMLAVYESVACAGI